METIQLIQATLIGAHERAERLLYAVQIDVEHVQQTRENSDGEDVLSAAIREVQAMISRAFSRGIVVWEAPVVLELPLPPNEPIWQSEGVKVWVMPVVSKNEAYFYLVG